MMTTTQPMATLIGMAATTLSRTTASEDRGPAMGGPVRELPASPVSAAVVLVVLSLAQQALAVEPPLCPFHALPNTVDKPIPAGHPTLRPRRSSMVAGALCNSTDYVNDFKTALMILLIELFNEYRFDSARSAPGCPEIH